MPTSLILHGHFYQPPRENPWTGVIDEQPSAAPMHDWNERVYYECYRPNAFARVLDANGLIDKIINNYQFFSFNLGPTLLFWMEVHHPFTYQQILEADRSSLKAHGGHGNAIAQAYNHAILPLCNERDRLTQIRWGVSDFKHRFGRAPESLWLSETAVNDSVMGSLIDEGLKYVILSPHQALRVRPLTGGDWRDVSNGDVDPGVAYLYKHKDGSGRSMAVFYYDPEIAKAIAFEGALRTSETLMELVARFPGGNGRLVHTATDGESYGHHFKFGDRSVAYAFDTLAPQRGFKVTNYGEFLSEYPAQWETEIKPGPNGEGTAWSCSHGVGRWIRDCGCHTGGLPGWTQAWRGPLREALDFLRDHVAAQFESERGKLFRDPWKSRDEYVRLLLDHAASREGFLDDQAGRPLSKDEHVRALTHLEIQRQALFMYTSCAWFFNDLSGIETIQVLQYAGRALDLLESLGIPGPRVVFLEKLAQAQSNIPGNGNGRDLFIKNVDTARVRPAQVSAHVAMAGLADPHQPNQGEAGGFTYEILSQRKESHGRLTLSTGRIRLQDLSTRRGHSMAFAALYMGGIDFTCNILQGAEPAQADAASVKLWDQFYNLPLSRFLGLMAETYGNDEFGMEHLLPEGRERVFGTVYASLVDRLTSEFALLYQENRRNLEMLQHAGFPIPRELTASAEFTLSRRFTDLILQQEGSLSPAAYQEAVQVAKEAARQGLQLDLTFADRRFSELLNRAVQIAVHEASDSNLKAAQGLLEVVKQMGLTPNLNRPQEILYEAAGTTYEFDKLSDLAGQMGLNRSLLAEKSSKRVVEELSRNREEKQQDALEGA